MAGINAPDPGICCESGTLCKFYNEYFWQCQPRGYVPLPEPEATFDGPSCKGKTQVGRCSMMDRPLHHMMCVAAAYMHEVHTIMFVAAVSLQYDVWLLYPAVQCVAAVSLQYVQCDTL
jgi:hypothetical protein